MCCIQLLPYPSRRRHRPLVRVDKLIEEGVGPRYASVVVVNSRLS
jgi:hypothetical protein